MNVKGFMNWINSNKIWYNQQKFDAYNLCLVLDLSLLLINKKEDTINSLKSIYSYITQAQAPFTPQQV
jgi:hypothetical protein